MLKVFDEKFFLYHKFEDITAEQLNEIYGIWLSLFTSFLPCSIWFRYYSRNDKNTIQRNQKKRQKQAGDSDLTGRS